MPKPLRIIITRDGVNIDDMRGTFGIAACGEGFRADPFTGEPLSEPPAVSLRCDTVGQLVLSLATLIATVRYVAGMEAVEAAVVMSVSVHPSEADIVRHPEQRGSRR